MSLDIHVGPLSRPPEGQWGSTGTATVAERRAAVLAWRDALSRRLADRLPVPLDWDETDHAPSFSGRPGWHGLAALVLWAAYAEHPAVRPPVRLPEELDSDPILQRTKADGFRSRYAHLVRNVELWLPQSFDFVVEGDDVDGRRVVMGSAVVLRRQLEDLNGATWKARPRSIAGWAGRELPGTASVEENARYAFAVLLDLADRAVEHRLPMKVGY
ncbi:MAG: hypothetical protein LCH95_04960 [Proteobacteria bacterium]|nr:hypothetical protein [Pseudomonadota bacterium]